MTCILPRLDGGGLTEWLDPTIAYFLILPTFKLQTTHRGLWILFHFKVRSSGSGSKLRLFAFKLPKYCKALSTSSSPTSPSPSHRKENGDPQPTREDSLRLTYADFREDVPHCRHSDRCLWSRGALAIMQVNISSLAVASQTWE